MTETLRLIDEALNQLRRYGTATYGYEIAAIETVQSSLIRDMFGPRLTMMAHHVEQPAQEHLLAA